VLAREIEQQPAVDRAEGEARAGGQFLQIVDGVLDHARDGAVIAGRGEQDAVGGADRIDEFAALVGRPVGAAIMGEAGDIVASECLHLGAMAARGVGGEAENALGAACGAGSSADGDDEAGHSGFQMTLML
jgi:hypothetical protein